MLNGTDRFIVLEGICCSGKTTFSNRLIKAFTNSNIEAIYNHGAMTYTELGREFYNLTAKMDTSISAVYYFTDLIINTREVLGPILTDINKVIVQDRYFDSVTTYTAAYGKYFNHNYNIYRIAQVLADRGYLLVPQIRIFCIPPYDVIVERMKNSKNTKVHDFYRSNPEFLRFVYNELLDKAHSTSGALIVDTSSESSISSVQKRIIEKFI